jgi:hypothetical protein
MRGCQTDQAIPAQENPPGVIAMSDTGRPLVAVLVILVLVVIVGVHYAAGRGSRAEHYGSPPGMLPSVWYRGYAPAGWADMPRDYEGNTASAISAYAMWSAGDGQQEEGELSHAWSPC